jgi:hypothetical protein
VEELRGKKQLNDMFLPPEIRELLDNQDAGEP